MVQRALKVQLMVFVMLALFHTKRQIDLLVWVIVLSIGFYGVKGGIYTLRTGAEVGRVWGPVGSFIEDNNAVGLALVITIPYGYYLFTEVRNRWGKAALLLTAGLCAIAALGTYSRGAFLAILAMSTLLWWRSRHKLMVGFAAVMAVPLLIAFLPDKWQDRMWGIADYERHLGGRAAQRLADRDQPLEGASDRRRRIRQFTPRFSAIRAGPRGLSRRTASTSRCSASTASSDSGSSSVC